MPEHLALRISKRFFLPRHQSLALLLKAEAIYKAKDVPNPKYFVKCGDCGAKTLVQASYGTVICSSCGKTVQYKTATEEDVINNLAIFLSQRR